MCETSSRIKITPEMLSYISALKKGTNSFKQEDLYIELEEGDDVLVLKVTESFVEKALTCLIGKVSTYSVRLKKENFPKEKEEALHGFIEGANSHGLNLSIAPDNEGVVWLTFMVKMPKEQLTKT